MGSPRKIPLNPGNPPLEPWSRHHGPLAVGIAATLRSFPQGPTYIYGSILGNSEEAGASKNEEARASNNEYRCHHQRVEILKEHIREMLRAVAGRSPDAGKSPFQQFQP